MFTLLRIERDCCIGYNQWSDEERIIPIGRMDIKISTNEKNSGVYYVSSIAIIDKKNELICYLPNEVNAETYFEQNTSNELTERIRQEYAKKYKLSTNIITAEIFPE